MKNSSIILITLITISLQFSCKEQDTCTSDLREQAAETNAMNKDTIAFLSDGKCIISNITLLDTNIESVFTKCEKRFGNQPAVILAYSSNFSSDSTFLAGFDFIGEHIFQLKKEFNTKNERSTPYEKWIWDCQLILIPRPFDETQVNFLNRNPQYIFNLNSHANGGKD